MNGVKLKSLLPLLISLGTIAVVSAVHEHGRKSERFDLLERLEWIAYDWRTKEALRKDPVVSDKLAFVNIGDQTVAQFEYGAVSTNLRFGLYWPRHIYGRLVRELKLEGAKAVGLDVIFDQLRPDHPNTAFGDKQIESDRYFQIQLNEAGNVILGTAEDLATHPTFRMHAAGLGDITTSLDPDGVLRRAKAFRDYRLWHPDILLMAQIAGWNLAAAQVVTNEIWFPNPDGTFKSLPITEDGLYHPTDLDGRKLPGVVRLRQAFEDVRVWHLGLTLAAQELGLDLNTAKVEKNRIVLSAANGLQRVIPVDEQARFLIDWSVPLEHPKVTKASFESIISRHVLRERGSNNVPATMLDKLVVVGSTASGNDLSDRGATPLTKDTFLTSNHWNVINSLLTNRFVREVAPWMTHALIAGFGILGGLVTWKLRPLWASVLVVICGVAYASFACFWFVKTRETWPIVMPLAGLVLTHFVTLSYQVFFERGEQRRVRQIFSKVVSSKVVDELLKTERISLGGTRVEATVFFADVRGFTEVTDAAQEQAEEYVRSHGLDPAEAEAYFDAHAAEVLRTVNAYLGVIADVIKQHDGTLDKYIGDCVMAFWGAPTPNPRHAVACVQAAIEAQRAIQALNERRSSENQVRKIENAIRARAGEAPLPALKLLALGTGINSGPMTAGLMGSSHYEANFTVFGREVNLAARLEAVSGSSRILIGEGTYRALLRDAPVIAATCAELPEITVKGFRQPVKVYEVPWKPGASKPVPPERAEAA